MRKETLEKLKKKGWTDKQIQKTQDIIDARLMKDKSRTLVYSQQTVFWTIIFLMVLGNFIISMLLIPLLLIKNILALDGLIILIGLGFGALFNLVIIDIRYIKKKYHLLAAFVIPLIAIINITYMVRAANALNSLFGIPLRDNPTTIALLYIIAFILPFLWSIFISRRYKIAYK